jgi:hypothetical protein
MRLLYPLLPAHRGLMRLAPEWLWRDFRLRLSRGRNHGSEERLDPAGLLWMVYHNFDPAQWRSERKRKYKHAGQSPLQVAGAHHLSRCPGGLKTSYSFAVAHKQRKRQSWLSYHTNNLFHVINIR